MNIVEEVEQRLARIATIGLVRQPQDWRKTKIGVASNYSDPSRLGRIDAAVERFNRQRGRDEIEQHELEQRALTGTLLEDGDEPVLQNLSRKDPVRAAAAENAKLLAEGTRMLAEQTRVVDYTKYFGSLDTDAREGLGNLAKRIDINAAGVRPWFFVLKDYIASLPQGSTVREMDSKYRDRLMSEICKANGGK